MDHADLFDVFGDYKGRTPDLDVSSTDIWFETAAPDQYLRTQMEEATFICFEHAVRVQNFDHDIFADVFFVNDLLKMLMKLLTTSTQSSRRLKMYLLMMILIMLPALMTPKLVLSRFKIRTTRSYARCLGG